MKNLIYLIAIFLQAHLIVAQNEIDPCVNDANTFPGAAQSPLYMQNIPYSDSRFLNNWLYWMDPDLLYNSDPNNPPNFNIPIYNMGMNPGEVYGDSPDTPPLTGMMSPLNSNGFQSHYYYLSRSNSSVFNIESNVLELLHPQNGWELLSVNRGYYPDGVTPIFWPETEGLFRKIPYLLFYNKYTGIARVYVRFGNNSSPNNSTNFADIIISHQDNNRMTGMLRLADGLDRTLDQKSIIKQIRTRVPSPGDASLWFSADFQMHYDPCVCEHESNITLNFKFYTTANLSIIGRSVTLAGDLTNEAFNDPSFLDVSGVFNDQGVAQDGYLIYRKYTDLMNDYLKKLEKYKADLDFVNAYNKEIERQIAILKIGMALVSSGAAGATSMPGFLSYLALIPSVKKEYDNTNGDFDKDVQKAFFKELDKALSIGFDLLIKENFEKKDKPDKPTTPTAAMSEFHFTGDIDIELPASGPVINTPGSKNAHVISASNMPWEFPVYNEALGVFALLEKPKVNISKTMERSFEHWHSQFVTVVTNNPANFDVVSIPVSYPSHNANSIIQINLAEPLKYYTNPALPIKDMFIEYSFEVVGETKLPESTLGLTPEIGYNQTFPHKVTIESRNSPSQNVNIQSTFFDANLSDTLFLSQNEADNLYYNSKIRFNTLPLPLDAALNTTFSFAAESAIKYPDVFRNHILLPHHYLNGLEFYYFLPTGIPVSSDVISTGLYRPFLVGFNDLNVFNSSAINNPTYYQNEQMPHFEIEQIKLKLIVNIEFDDIKLDDTPQHHSYVFTYAIDLDDIHNPEDPTSNGSIIWSSEPYLNPNLVGSSADYTQFDEVSVFEATIFDGSAINNCMLTGTQYECKGRYAVEIAGDISVNPGYSVRFVAPEIITVEPEAVIDPEVELVIEPVIQNLIPMPQQSYTEVQTFCTNDYEARQLQRSLAIFYDSLAQANPAPEPLPTPIQFILFPNPTTGASQAGIYLPELATVSITIIDVSGKIVGSPVQNLTLANGRNVQNLETESLQPGVYLVHLVVNGEKFVQRLVKQ